MASKAWRSENQWRQSMWQRGGISGISSEAAWRKISAKTSGVNIS